MEIFQDRLLKDYSTFKIGGKANFLVEIRTAEEASKALDFAKQNQLNWLTIGKGSNCLFPDHGFIGLVIVNCINHFQQQDHLFKAGAGFSFAYLGVKTAALGYSGLEFASGIPGSVGGAVYMNAGASGKETFDVLKNVTFLSSDGEIETFDREKLSFSYRKSVFQRLKGIIIDATFELEHNEQAKKLQQSLLAGRIKTQPYQSPSIGCFFKNPSHDIRAGYLIDQCGLKGVSVGGAKVSEIHANFIVNQEGASAEDVINLRNLIQKKVFEKTGIQLEEEVRIIS